MVTLQSAENALKSLYLGVVADQLNVNTNPFLAKVERTQSDVWGKEIVKLASYGINGGIGAGSEEGALPAAAGNNYAQMKTTLKNLYGTIELSDKAIYASANNSGAFVNLLNAEMEGLLKASKFNLGRMLYGTEKGVLCTVKATPEGVTLTNNMLVVSSIKNLIEGMVVDIYAKSSTTPTYAKIRIKAIDRDRGIITLVGTFATAVAVESFLTVQGSFNQELTGLGSIFDTSATALYGLNRAENSWLNPVNESATALTLNKIQGVMDRIEEVAGSGVDFILTSYALKREYLNLLNVNRRNIDYMNLDGGYKALCYNGVAVVADRFVDDNAMYFLNSKDFKLHQLCDWRWVEGEQGRILHQKAGYPTYSATLVKYADLMCDRPIAQVKLTIAE